MNSIQTNKFLQLFIIIGLSFFVHSFMLEAPFKSMDDNFSILKNEKVQNINRVKEFFGESFFGEGHYYRPLVYVSFAIEYELFHANSFYFHFTNLLIHLLCTLCVYCLIYKLKPEKMYTFWTALLFAVHPINSEVVWNIPDRAILLNTLFILSSFLFYLWSKKAIIIQPLSWICFVAALCSKESAIMFPAVIVMHSIFIDKKKALSRETIVSALPYGLLAVGYLFLRQSLGITSTFDWLSWQDRFLGFVTFLLALVDYVRLLVFPVDLYFDRSHILFTSLTNIFVWVVLIFWVSIGFFVRSQWGRYSGTVRFFLVWALLELFPVSQLVTSIGVSPGVISTAEHFLYVPSIGLFFMLTAIFYEFLKHNKEKKWVDPKGVQFFIYGIMIFFSLTTIQQNIIATSSIAMLTRSAQMNPNNARVLNSLALEYASWGDVVSAEKYFRETIKVNRSNTRAHIGLAKSLCDQGRYIEGVSVYEAILKPGKFKALLDGNLRLTYISAVKHFKDKINDEGESADLLFTLGTFQFKTGAVNDAKDSFSRVLELDPLHKHARYNLDFLSGASL